MYSSVFLTRPTTSIDNYLIYSLISNEMDKNYESSVNWKFFVVFVTPEWRDDMRNRALIGPFPSEHFIKINESRDFPPVLREKKIQHEKSHHSPDCTIKLYLQ